MNMEREVWLNKAKDLIIEKVFKPHELIMPPILTIAAGPLTGRTLGVCTRPQYSDEAAVHVWISALLGSDDVMQILGVICHELVHANCNADGFDECGHSHPFSERIKTVGLEGKPKQATAHEGTELWSTLEGIAAELGPYPHKPLRPKEKKTRQSEILTLESETDPEFQVKIKFSQVYEKGMPRDFNDQPMKPKDPAKFAELEELYLSKADEEEEAEKREEEIANAGPN